MYWNIKEPLDKENLFFYFNDELYPLSQEIYDDLKNKIAYSKKTLVLYFPNNHEYSRHLKRVYYNSLKFTYLDILERVQYFFREKIRSSGKTRLNTMLDITNFCGLYPYQDGYQVILN